MTDSSIFNEIKTANEKQIGGSHYKQFFIQPWTFIRKNKLNPLQANIIKYVCRYLSKGKAIEDLEKIPAYKRMGIEINNSKSQNEDIFSKTILNEENKLEFPDVNTYLHDNVD